MTPARTTRVGMHRRFGVGLLVCAALALAPLAGTAYAYAEGDEDEALTGVTDVVVAVKPGTSVDAVAADHGLTHLRALPGSADIHLLRVASGGDASDASQRLSSDVRVRFAEPNYAGAMPEGNPNYAWGASGPRWTGTDARAWRSQPALDRVGVPDAHDSSTGDGTLVARAGVVRIRHPDAVQGGLAAPRA